MDMTLANFRLFFINKLKIDNFILLRDFKYTRLPVIYVLNISVINDKFM